MIPTMPRVQALLIGVLISGVMPGMAADAEALQRLLQHRQCPGCQLADVELVHADLRDADLSGAALQRANLSRVNLDGADLRNSNLSFTSLRGASLRGADLRGSRLYGADLRHADLSGARLDPEALEQSHWQGAQGIASGIRSHAALHNTGVEAAQAGRWRDAERLFSEAIQSQPEEPLSWVARGISRGELGRLNQAANDLAYAGTLFEQSGDTSKAQQLEAASQRLKADLDSDSPDGYGVGSTLLGGALSVVQSLAPLALRALMPLMP